MNIENRFDIIVAVVIYISPQLGIIVAKAQDLVVSFRLGEVEYVP